MHCLLEGLAQAQFHEFLGLTTAFAMKAQSEAGLRPAFSFPFRSFDTPTILSKNDHAHTESIQTLLTSAIDCTEKDDHLHVEEYIARLETKLMNKNCAALKFVAEGLQLQPLRKEDTCITAIMVRNKKCKIRKIHWANALIEWVCCLIYFALWSQLIRVPCSARPSRCLRPL